MTGSTPITAKPWREVEFTLTAAKDYANGYTDVEVWADFTHDDGTVLRRPAFWDGGRTWQHPLCITAWLTGAGRGAPSARRTMPGWPGKVASSHVKPVRSPANRFYRHGFWRMSPGKRSLVHADGRAGGAGRRHGLGLALARHARRVRNLRRRPPGQGLQRRAADERPAGHGRPRPARPQRRRRLRRRLRGPARRPHQPAQPGLFPVPRRPQRHSGRA